MEILDRLCDKLRGAFGERLVSVILYGSAAAGDRQAGYSDYNVLCVLEAVTPAEMAAAEPIFGWWRKQGSPAPLLMAEQELAAAARSFPIEFHDIRENHRVLAGRNLLSTVPLDESYYRAQVEHELRAKLLRLRQKASGIMSSTGMLRRLLADSVSTFCVLFRHALLLCGEAVPVRKRETLERAADVFGIDRAPFIALLDLREGRVKPRDVDPLVVLPPYLAGISAITDAIRGLDK